MKVYIIAAISADGFIAKSSKEFIDWTSAEDKKFFSKMTKKTGVIVVGGNTFRTFKAPLSGRRHIVYTNQLIENTDVETTNEKPADLVERLEKEGLEELAICGGNSIYTMFLKSGLVTDIYLTIEPVFFGKGIKLMDESLKLFTKDMKQLNKDTFMIHYGVKK